MSDESDADTVLAIGGSGDALRATGLAVAESDATDVDAALAAVERADPDCVVCAPAGFGDPAALLAGIRERDERVPFVLVTDAPLDPFVERGLISEVAAVVRPGDAAALADSVTAAIDRARERRRTRQIEQRYRMLVEESPSPIGILDRDARFLFVNGALAAFLGVDDPDELIGEDSMRFVPEEGLELSTERIERVVEAREAVPAVERELVDADGRTRHAAIASQPVTFEGEPAVQIVVSDVTEHEALAAELREQRDRFLALFEHLSEPVVETRLDEGPIVTAINPAFAETFGVTEAEIVGEPLDDHIVPGDDREAAASFNRRARDGEQLEVEVSRVTPEGERDFLLRFVPLELDDEVRGGFAIYIDITERREWERQLRRQNERLEEVARVVSHDLRNPLNVAQGTAAHLAESATDDQREHVERLQRAHDRIAAIIEDMLTLARQGQSVSDLEPVSLAAVAEAAWETVQTGGATLSVEADARIRADANRLRQLFENLYRNAVEHGRGDATVRVGVIADGGDRSPSGFYVEDDGPGIPSEDRDAVFEAGYTTGDDTTGFGLSIVQSIAEAHGWDVSVAGSEGVSAERDGASEERAGPSGERGARFEITGVEPAE